MTADERENEEKGVGKKKKDMRKMRLVGLFVNKPKVTNTGLSGEACRVLGVCVCVTPGRPKQALVLINLTESPVVRYVTCTALHPAERVEFNCERL